MKKFKKIYVEITNICNLNCHFCKKDDLKKQTMTLDQFEHVLKAIDKYTDYLYLHVKGEPLLHPNFEQLLQLCKHYNKQVNITTNGTLLKQKSPDIVASKAVRQINISLQSLIDINNLNDILNTAELLSSKGIKIVFRIWVNTNLTKKIITKIEEKYNLAISGNTKLNDNTYINFDEEFIWPNLNNEVISKIGTCYGSRTHIAILVSGKVVPCCLDSEGVIDLGNIFEESLEQIIDKDKFQNIRKNFQNNKLCEELCQKCGFRTKLGE